MKENEMAGKFQGKSILVAGGTGALGRAVVMSFLDESAGVAVTYRRQEEFDALKHPSARMHSSRVIKWTSRMRTQFVT
jgi:NAD(P)-dependent dehydrogenase (short-subunit alcohol dehydrogenase family)